MPNDFEAYLADEWRLFAADATRQREARRAVAHLTVGRVLDAGCGSGQDLIPFASQGLTCVGGDIAHANAVWATQQFGTHYPHLAVRFATSAVEHLPFRATFFDVVLCRHAQRLPGPPSRGFKDRFEALRRAPMPGSLPSPYRVLTRRIVRE